MSTVTDWLAMNLTVLTELLTSKSDKKQTIFFTQEVRRTEQTMNVLLMFSSTKHKMLMVSYCDPLVSVVHRASPRPLCHLKIYLLL